MEINKIYNEDCMVTMDKMDANSIDIVLTSPFYNTSRNGLLSQRTRNPKHPEDVRYDGFNDVMTNKEYCDFTVKLFEGYDKILKKDGCILYNISYGTENTEGMFLAVNDIITRTNFTLADCIVWKKKAALPNNVSSNKLTRITEFVFVFCRRDDFMTFKCNKKVVSVMATGQASYENIFNYIEAANNDGTCPLNKATYSTELCEKLLRIYAPDNALVYDSFMGSGTTAVACKKLGYNYIGSELSAKQVEWARARLGETVYNPDDGKPKEMSIFDSFDED